eukprot:GHVR01110477.1.p1 GENE.GHVR01110477.1~~GHVR01110477.1.p1  ORF type:complete len:356 (+),score=45.52 GHVR01110477.1:255-1322(+)
MLTRRRSAIEEGNRGSQFTFQSIVPPPATPIAEVTQDLEALAREVNVLKRQLQIHDQYAIIGDVSRCDLVVASLRELEPGRVIEKIKCGERNVHFTHAHEQFGEVLKSQCTTMFQSLSAENKLLITAEGEWVNMWDTNRPHEITMPFQTVSNILRCITELRKLHQEWAIIFERSFVSSGMLGSLKDGLQKSYYKDEDYRTHVMLNKEKGFGQGDQERVMPRQSPPGNNQGFNNNNNNNRGTQQYPQGVSQNYKGQYPIPGFNRGFYNNNNNTGANQSNTHTHTHTSNYLPDGRRASQMGPPRNAIGHTPVCSFTHNTPFSHITPLTKSYDTNLIHKNLNSYSKKFVYTYTQFLHF